jgi:hypothetical protein
MHLEALPQPPRVDRHDDDEQRKRQQQVHGLQYLDHTIGLAAVEVVDVEDDAPHGEQSRLAAEWLVGEIGRLLARVPAVLECLGPREQLAEPFEVASDECHQSELFLVVLRAASFFQEVLQLTRRVQGPQLLFESIARCLA